MPTRRKQARRNPERLLFLLPVAAMVVAAVALWTVLSASKSPPIPPGSANGSAATQLTGGPTPSGRTNRPTEAPSASPTQATRSIQSIVLVAAIGEDEDGSPSGLAWQAVQEAADGRNAGVTRVSPLTRAEMTAGIARAAAEGATIVVAVGPDATSAVLSAASAHPETQFLLLGATVPSTAPANIEAIVFDESEAGYLAGLVAGSVSTSGSVGFVGDLQGDVASANFAVGFASGTPEGSPTATASVAYAGRISDPQKGGAAASGLLKSGADVIAGMPGPSGNGALRTACKAGARVIALETDASLILPDVSDCLVVSVLFRYDVVLGEAISTYAGGGEMPTVLVGDVANGGVGLSTFYQTVSQGTQDRVSVVLEVLAAGPPRPTPAPPTPVATPATSKKP